MKLLPKAKGLGEVISAALLSLLIKAAAFKELYKLLKHEAADKSSVQHSTPLYDKGNLHYCQRNLYEKWALLN